MEEKITYKEYFDLLTKESPEEIEIQKAITDHKEAFYATPEYAKYAAEEAELRDKWKALIHARHAKAKELRPNRKEKALSIDEFANIIQESRKNQYEQLSDDAKRVMKEYKNLSKSDQQRIKDLVHIGPELDPIKEKKTTDEDIWMLQVILAQTCKDFIEERGLDDIFDIHFSISEPTGLCDATTYVGGVEWDEEAQMHVRKEIGFTCC